MSKLKILLILASSCLILASCTMSVTQLTTGSAVSYAEHEQKNGISIGIKPMTNKGEIEDMFKVNLLDEGLLPILVVAENQSASASFIIAKDKVFVLNEATKTTSSSQRKEVTSGISATAVGYAGAALGSTPLLIAGVIMASDATVIQHNLADKEFYSRTLGPGEKAQGFVYFQFPKESLPSGSYHLVAEVTNSATGKATTFDFPVNLTLTK
jgi:hypothetical protein